MTQTIERLNVMFIILFLLSNTQVSSHKVTHGITKNVLVWTRPKEKYCRPFDTIGTGNSVFKKFNCIYDNCYIHRVKGPLHEVTNATDYDAIMFNGKLLPRMNPDEHPKQRTADQIYIFVQLDSAAKHPILSEYYDNFFNWTMTYRLDSDIPWTYFQIKSFNNKTVGPSQNVQWMHPEEMLRMNKYFKSKFRYKSRTAWFTSNCHTIRTEKDDYINLLNERLAKLGQRKVDIVYGACGRKVCHKSNWHKFHTALEKNYFFYMAMENSYDKDFVTDKLLTAFQHNTLPIVYGGADYSRFAPPGSFISVNNLSPNKLAAIIANLMRKPANYHEFFKWRNHYFYTDNYDLSGVACDLCEKLNKDKRRRSYQHFRRWWNRDHVDVYPLDTLGKSLPDTYEVKNISFPKATTKSISMPKDIAYLRHSELQSKSILLWSPPVCNECSLFDGFKTGNTIFKELECEYYNCYIDRGNMSNNPAVYDAILILGQTVHKMQTYEIKNLPLMRRENQFYVFVELESPDTYPVCEKIFENYFNWTMTYRLDSDIPWPYFKIQSIEKETIGPRQNINWFNTPNMQPIDNNLKEILNKKTKLAVWTVSNCYEAKDMIFMNSTNDASGRINFVHSLNKELLSLNSTPVDVYEQCRTQIVCPNGDLSSCDLLKEDYLFYLAFENAIDRDYVTDTILTAFNNYAVPIVYGGADYDRFAPPGSYLNALQLGPISLAEEMIKIYNDRKRYHEFFRWRSLYTFNDNFRLRAGAACDLCAKLNQGKVEPKKYNSFRFWWNRNWWSLCKNNGLAAPTV